MPVSKKRKTKQKSGAYPQKKVVAPPKKITRQKVLIYVISGLMILSLMLGYLATGSRRSAVPTPVPQSENVVEETPAPDAPSGDATPDSAQN